MRKSERVLDNLNRGLHHVFEKEPRAYLLGEDLLDPYGGAFKATKGLSTRFPDRILTTPISEQTILGTANGLALCGDKPIVEIMFGDFIALGFDQILNVAAKTVSMFGRKLSYHLIVRCTAGGHRGYGPTHSQSLQKHFVGVPNLKLFEMSPFHDNSQVLKKILNIGEPCIFFENKILYGKPFIGLNPVQDIFTVEEMGGEDHFVRIKVEDSIKPEVTILTPGGSVYSVLEGLKNLLIDYEIESQVFVPSRLYPFEIDGILPFLKETEHIFLIEESTAGGTWGDAISQTLYEKLWGKLKNPIGMIHSEDSIIPSAKHLEHEVLVQDQRIYEFIKKQAIDA